MTAWGAKVPLPNFTEGFTMKRIKDGSAKMALLISVAVISVVGVLVSATIDSKSVGGGTYTLSESSGVITLTVDAIASALTGSVAGSVVGTTVSASTLLAVTGDVTVDGVAGYTGIVTNDGQTITNVLYYHEGIVTNVVKTLP